jgi:hypothetical protein
MKMPKRNRFGVAATACGALWAAACGGTFSLGDVSYHAGATGYGGSGGYAGMAASPTAGSGGTISRVISNAGGPGWIATELDICDIGNPSHGLSVASACALNPDFLPNPPTQEQFVASFVGDWIACSQPTIFGTDEFGIDLEPDGNFYELFWDGVCGVNRGGSVNAKGTWEVTMTTESNGQPHFQLYFHITGGGGLGGDVAVGFAGKLRLTTDTPLSPTDYVLWQGPVL